MVDTTPTPVSLRVRIAETGIRQFLVASEVGISSGHLSHILRGRKIVDAALMERIAQAIETVAEREAVA
jgi:transcriptional regulator with XRE-family HTH domain